MPQSDFAPTEPCVVLVGPPFEQQELYGPFASFEEADEWTRGVPDAYTYIVTLNNPEGCQ